MATPSWIDVMLGSYNDSGYDYDYNFTIEAFETVCKSVQVLPTWVLLTMYIILCILNIIGNGVVIGILCRYYKVMQPMDMMMVSLCLASFVFMISMGFDILALAGIIEISTSMCKIQFFLLGCSILWISYITAMIAVLRTLLIMLPTRTWIKHRCVGICMLILALLLGLICGITAAVYADAVVSGKGAMCYLTEHRMLLLSLNSLFAFVIPLVIIIFCYGLSCYRLCKRRFQASKAYSAFFLAITLFILLCAPRHLIRMVDTVMRLGIFQQTCTARQTLDIMFLIGDVMNMLYCALVSFAYAITGSLFRIRLGQCMFGIWRRASGSE